MQNGSGRQRRKSKAAGPAIKETQLEPNAAGDQERGGETPEGETRAQEPKAEERPDPGNQAHNQSRKKKHNDRQRMAGGDPVGAAPSATEAHLILKQ